MKEENEKYKNTQEARKKNMPEDKQEEEEFESVYNDEGREALTENDEISPEEEAFMAGYDEEKDVKEKDKKGDKAYEEAFDK